MISTLQQSHSTQLSASRSTLNINPTWYRHFTCAIWRYVEYIEKKIKMGSGHVLVVLATHVWVSLQSKVVTSMPTLHEHR